jgi:hypothetical protein
MNISTGRVVLIHLQHMPRANSFRTARCAANFWGSEKSQEWFAMNQRRGWADWDLLIEEMERRRKKLVRRSIPVFQRMLEGR